MPLNGDAHSEYICLHCCKPYYNASMKLIEAIRAVNDISSSQRGLFTSAQARMLGVERYALSRLEGLGNIERLAKGIYRMGGSPSTREEDVLAAWLSIDPGRRPGDIAGEGAPVAMGGDGGVALQHRRGRPLALRVLHAREKTDQAPKPDHQEAPPRPEGRDNRLGHPGDEALAHGGGPDRLREGP